MAAWTVAKILSRETAANAKRGEMKPYIDRAMQFAMPWRVQHGRKTAFEQLFDSSGPTGVHKFGSRLQRDLTPPFARWFKLEGGPLIPEDKIEAVNRQLELATAVCHAALDASSFANASGQAYADLSIGTAGLLAVEGDDEELIRWTAVPPWGLSIEEGASGRVDNIYWRRKYPCEQLPELWPKAVWPEAIRRKIAEGKNDEVEILQASYWDLIDRVFRFAVIVCEVGANGGKGVVALEQINRTNPWIIFRWWTTPGNPWGMGPLLLTLPDVMTANKAVEMILKAAAYALAPPLMVAHDGVVNPDNLRVAPHALIRVARTGGPMGSSIQPLDMNGRVDLTQLALQDMRQNIAQNLMARQLPPESAAVRSPTEIVERMREFQFDTGSAFGRLNHEYIPAVIARVLDILDKKQVPGIDFRQLKVDQLILRVRVTSPLAQQQNLEDVERYVRFAELVKAIGGAELMAAVLNLEEMHRLGPMLGAPGWASRPREDREAMLQTMGEAAAEGQDGLPVPAGASYVGGEPALGLVRPS